MKKESRLEAVQKKTEEVKREEERLGKVTRDRLTSRARPARARAARTRDGVTSAVESTEGKTPAKGKSRTTQRKGQKRETPATHPKGGGGIGGRPLIIVESPTKARTLSKFLGTKFQIRASSGHIMDLPKAKLGVEIDRDFEPQYVLLRSKSKALREIKQAAGNASEVYLAPDPDREGEAIAWHLQKFRQ